MGHCRLFYNLTVIAPPHFDMKFGKFDPRKSVQLYNKRVIALRKRARALRNDISNFNQNLIEAEAYFDRKFEAGQLSSSALKVYGF